MNAGEVLGLIGPNGAGKTTLLEAIAGLIPADDGRVLWRGAPLPLRQRRERMFYLPDGLRPWEDQYVASVIGFFTAAYGRSEGFVAGVVRALGLAPVLRKRVARIVEGIWPPAHAGARAADPASAAAHGRAVRRLRPRQTREIMGVIREVAGSGRTLVLAIHQLVDAERVCDRFVLLADGHIRGVGTLDELRAQTGKADAGLEDVFLALT